MDKSKIIYIEIKNNYGKQLAYPACGTAKYFALIARTETLSINVLGIIQGLGYRIEQVPSKNVFGDLIGGLSV